MKCNITQTTLGELSVGRRGYYGLGAPAVPYSPSLYTYLRITDINDDGTLNMSDLKSVSADNASDYLLKINDIVFARTGASTGRNYFYDGTDGDFVFAGFLIKFSLDPSKVNPRYVKYYCQSKEYRDWIAAFNTGSTRGNINTKTLASMPIRLPDMETQHRIVNILDALENKRKNNKQINDNLQQQAFALFEQLLLTADDGECSVADIAHLNPKRALAKNQEAKCIEMSQLSTSGAFPSGWEKRPFNGGMRFSNGDTLLARITPCLENGKAAFIDFLDTSEVAFGSTEYIVLAPKGEIPPEFLYCLARYPVFSDYAVKNMNGSSGRQRVSAETIGQFKLPRPSTNELKRFGNVVSSLFLKMRFNSLENMRLSSLRDSLLPKLMSGELDVSELDI
ncbi:restriction endonuclease subunit S [Bilophila wadsworthia]